MSQPFVAEIKMFAGNFAIRGYAFCNGQLLSIAQNTALFSLLGTIYGGDGRTTFGLPNLQGSAAMHWGNGPGLTNRFIGETGGESSVTLVNADMPAHNHQMQCNEVDGTLPSPGNATFGMSGGRGRPSYYAVQGTAVPMAPQALGITGGSQPHNNMQPYLAVNFIIALQGIYPPRN